MQEQNILMIQMHIQKIQMSIQILCTEFLKVLMIPTQTEKEKS